MKHKTNQLYTRSKAKLQRFVGSRVRDPVVAEDMVQEIFLEAITYMDSGKSIHQPEGLLFKIARRRIIDYYRRKEAQPATQSEVSVPGNDEPTIYEMLHRKELLEPGARQLIDQLPEAYRRVLHLTEMEDRPHLEVAEKLGISLSAVKSRVSRGREKLRQLIHHYCHVEYDHTGNVRDFTPKCDCQGCLSVEIEK